MTTAERDVSLGDLSFRIAEAGVGARPLLLVHGFTGAKEDFTPWLPELAERGWHAVAPDLRGHGARAEGRAEESAYSYEIMARDCLQLADALGWDSFVLLGHSMGGMIAQFMALDAPGRIAGLILMDTAHGPVRSVDPDLVQAAVTVVRDQGIDTLAEILAANEGPLTTPAHRRLLDERPGYREFEDGKFRASAPGMYAAMAPVLVATADRLDQLHGLPASLPVLVIVGDQDQPFIADSERMAAAIGTGTLAVISDAGHCPQFENTDEWWQALTGFLATL